MIIHIKAQFSGEFRAIKQVDDSVSANEIFGTIFRGGVFNDQTTSDAGTITFIHPDHRQVSIGDLICSVDNESI